MSDLQGVSLADALADYISHVPWNHVQGAERIGREAAEVAFKWFRTNREFIEPLIAEIPLLGFDALLDAATRLGVEERTPQP